MSVTGSRVHARLMLQVFISLRPQHTTAANSEKPSGVALHPQSQSNQSLQVLTLQVQALAFCNREEGEQNSAREKELCAQTERVVDVRSVPVG